MYVVEILQDRDPLATSIARMRDWLDTHQITPTVFTWSSASDSLVFRVTFVNAGEATSFAQAFGGQLIGATAPQAT